MIKAVTYGAVILKISFFFIILLFIILSILIGGVLLYIMLYGMPPFYDNSNDRGKIIKKIQSKELEFMDDVEISESAKDLLKLMLEKNPQERITAQDALKHEWIKKRD